MTSLGWIACGTLCERYWRRANTFPKMLNYAIVAIAVCARCAALIALARRASRPAVRNGAADLWPEAAALKLMAAQTPFAESRLRLLALADQMEKRGR
jgi:hypothetical protein